MTGRKKARSFPHVTGDPSEPKRPGGEPRQSDPHRDVAGALHDVSNALTVMLGWVSEARAPFAKSEAIAYALGIIEQRAKIARDLARRAIGATPMIFETDDLLEATIGDALDALAVEVGRSGVKLTRSIDARGARIASAGDVSQILTNVVMNAIAHAPPGSEVKVTVEAADRTITVDVQDGGPGVVALRRDSIFTGDTDRAGGAGIGLRHARALARAANGDLELIASAGGETGALFRLTWPRAGVLPPPPVSAPRTRLLQGQRVLVLEDDADVTQLLEAALGARGATVIIAHNAAELASALASAHEGAAGVLDAALVDLSPIADDVAGAINALRTSCPEARLVVMTGSAEALPDAVSTEGVRLVRKPFEVSEVVAALTEGRRPQKK